MASTRPVRAWVTALAAAALLLRLLLPAGPMPAAMDPLTELLSGGGICHGDPDGSAQKPAGLACLLCPFCTGPAPVLVAVPPHLPGAAVVPHVAARAWPPATAPPVAVFRPANPRAPPALSA